MNVALNPWVTRDTAVAYENPWISVEHSNVVTPGGNDGVYGVVHFKNYAVGVIPIDEADHTWLVGQYRYALDEYSWEIPAGGSPIEGSVQDTARRELREETGIIARTLTPLLSEVRLTNSVTDETAWIYTATDLSFTDAEPEECEELAVRRVPVDKAIEMVLDGSINDALSIMSLLRLRVIRSNTRAANT